MAKRKAAAKLPPMSEDELLEATRDAALKLGYRWYHTNDSRRSVEGYPDVSMIGNGKAIWAELKKEGEKMTEAQERWAADIGDLPEPCWFFLVHPSTFDHFVQRITQFREEYRNGRKGPPPAPD